MEDNYSFQDYLRQSLHQLFPGSKDDGAKNNVLINCPLCIKEGKADTKHHMSICLGNDGKPLFYNCFRNTSHRGILTSDTLINLAWNAPIAIDPMLLSAIDEFSKHNSSYSKYRLIKDNKINLSSINTNSEKINEMKRQYICNRIGVDLPFEELLKDKIVFSIKDLLWRNYIHQYTRDERIINLLDQNFVGFLSNNNTSISMRNMVYNTVNLGKNLNYRYIKYVIVQGMSAGYYIIPSICNITQRIEIIISEGHFDILSIFYNIYNADRYNRIYSCIGGNSYLNIIKYFLCDMGIVDPIFHIFIDNDVKRYVINEIKKVLEPLNIEVYIHMNGYKEEKDFGVPKEKIKDYSYRLT